MARTTEKQGPPPVQSVGRSLDLLEALTGEELGLAAVAARVGLGPSTAYRLLTTLVDRGYVARSPKTGAYRIGHKVTELANFTHARDERLLAIVPAHLRALRDATGETANLVVLDGHAVVYVAQAESAHTVRMFTTIGRRVPLHASGGGKALVAFSSPDLTAELLAAGLPRLTDNTLVTAQAFRAAVAQIGELGYAIDNEEYETGVVCVAAPLIAAGSEPRAAITVSGPAARMRDRDLNALGALLRTHAERAATELSGP